jgi:hypothetical protein
VFAVEALALEAKMTMNYILCTRGWLPKILPAASKNVNPSPGNVHKIFDHKNSSVLRMALNEDCL